MRTFKVTFNDKLALAVSADDAITDAVIEHLLQFQQAYAESTEIIRRLQHEASIYPKRKSL